MEINLCKIKQENVLNHLVWFADYMYEQYITSMLKVNPRSLIVVLNVCTS